MPARRISMSARTVAGTRVKRGERAIMLAALERAA
jgi:hypothetical protein